MADIWMLQYIDSKLISVIELKWVNMNLLKENICELWNHMAIVSLRMSTENQDCLE